MSEFSIEDAPDPLPRLKNGLHYYDLHDFIQEIVPADSLHTRQYREWYPQASLLTKEDDDIGAQSPEVTKLPLRSSGILRGLGRFARIASVE